MCVGARQLPGYAWRLFDLCALAPGPRFCYSEKRRPGASRKNKKRRSVTDPREEECSIRSARPRG